MFSTILYQPCFNMPYMMHSPKPSNFSYQYAYITLKFGWQFSSIAAEKYASYQSNWKILNTNLMPLPQQDFKKRHLIQHGISPQVTAVKICLEYAVPPKNYVHSLDFTLLWFCMARCTLPISYKLSREYRLAWNRYSWLLFTSEYRFCANFCVQEQSVNMTSQCQYPTFTWHHRSTVVTSQY